MKKKIMVGFGLALLATPAFARPVMEKMERTFTFNYMHPTLGRIVGVASVDVSKDLGTLTRHDFEIKSLTNPVGELPLKILNNDEITRAQLYALASYQAQKSHE